MAVTEEAARRKLYNWMSRHIGDEEADSIMEAIPRTRWEDLVTKDHLDARLADLRTELKGDIGGLRGETKDDIAKLRGEMYAGFARVDAALRAQLYWTVGAILTVLAVLVPLIVALH